jgi:hypothetical protein
LTDERPRPLRVAAAIVVLQVTAELAYVVGRGELTLGLRVGLMAVLALQLVFIRNALRLSAGSVLGLLAFGTMAVVAAIAGDGALVVRLGLAATALSVMVLLLMSIPAFPSPDLPKIT